MHNAIRTARTVFLEAIEHVAPEQWQPFVESACADDKTLRGEVLRLLAAHGKPGSFMAQPAGRVMFAPEATIELSATERIGDRIGRYKLMEQLGEGGMGVVFVAEQTEPVRRKVALKIIKPGMDSREVIARFEAERQALAMMDHPNIAKVLDAGTTGAGRPYFVMELVRGMLITDYCDKAKLTPKKRLELFVSVCHAVQHAHQKGIIHRDLKPSNILVTMHDGVGVPKVIDFGVAKALHQQLTEHTIYTAYSQVIGTPLYMSPEQAELSALDVDTRSDVYSLGVLLYELLTGKTPFDSETLRKAGLDEMRRMIREDEPLRPSLRLSTFDARARSTISQQRSLDERRLGQILRGELDWIVMKALEKDRTHRYESASALAADLERYLRQEPVLACPPSTIYRVRKLARRHKGVLAAAVLILVALLTGTAIASWQAVRAMAAEQQANDQRQQSDRNLQAALIAVEQLLTHVGNPDLAEIPQLQDTFEKILRDSLEFYERFTVENVASPQLQYRAAVVFQRVALLAKESKQHSKAVDAFARAVSLADRLVEQAPDRKDYREFQAAIHLSAGRLYLDFAVAMDAPDMAHRHLTRAEQLYHNLSLSEPGVKEYPALQGDALLAQAMVIRKRIPSDPRVAILAQRAYELTERSIPSWNVMKLMGDLAAASNPEKADVFYRRSMADLRGHASSDRANKHSRAWLFSAAATHFSARHPGEAELLWKESIDLAAQNARAFPTIVSHRVFLGSIAGTYVRFLVSLGRVPEAGSLLKDLVSEFPTAARLHAERAVFLRDAMSSDESVAALTAALKEFPSQHEYYRARGVLHQKAGTLDAALNDLDRAVALGGGWIDRAQVHLARKEYQLAVDDATATLTKQPHAGWYYKRRAVPLFELARFSDALADLRTAVHVTPADVSILTWIPPSRIAACPDASFREGFLKLVDDAVRLNNKSTEARVMRAVIRMEFGDRAGALADLRGLGNEIQLQEINFRCLAALVALKLEDKSLYRRFSEENLTRLANAPKDDLHMAAWTAAIVSNVLDDYGPAITLARRAAELHPRRRDALQTLGAVLLRAGEYREALPHLEAAAEAKYDGNTADAYASYLLALAEFHLNNQDEARKHLRIANELAEKDLAGSPVWNRTFTLQLLRNEAEQLIGRQ